MVWSLFHSYFAETISICDTIHPSFYIQFAGTLGGSIRCLERSVRRIDRRPAIFKGHRYVL